MHLSKQSLVSKHDYNASVVARQQAVLGVSVLVGEDISSILPPSNGGTYAWNLLRGTKEGGRMIPWEGLKVFAVERDLK